METVESVYERMLKYKQMFDNFDRNFESCTLKSVNNDIERRLIEINDRNDFSFSENDLCTSKDSELIIKLSKNDAIENQIAGQVAQYYKKDIIDLVNNYSKEKARELLNKISELPKLYLSLFESRIDYLPKEIEAYSLNIKSQAFAVTMNKVINDRDVFDFSTEIAYAILVYIFYIKIKKSNKSGKHEWLRKEIEKIIYTNDDITLFESHRIKIVFLGKRKQILLTEKFNIFYNENYIVNVIIKDNDIAFA